MSEETYAFELELVYMDGSRKRTKYVTGSEAHAKRLGCLRPGVSHVENLTPLTRPEYRNTYGSKRGAGFTLIELQVVIVIILIVSAIALPTIYFAMSHRQVSEGARILQGALAGARDDAIHNNSPSGFRLLPDPAFPIQRLADGTIDPSQPLASNRMIPIAAAPDYTTGRVLKVDTSQLPAGFMPYPALMCAEAVVSPDPATGAPLPNEPTSWWWNIRLGDKIQIAGAGKWYTVVGPCVITAAPIVLNGVTYSNPELFVNIGPPNTPSPYATTQVGVAVRPEFLWLVNGRDDNGNGWIDEGFDGVDNDGDGLIDETHCALHPLYGEWEVETW